MSLSAKLLILFEIFISLVGFIFASISYKADPLFTVIMLIMGLLGLVGGIGMLWKKSWGYWVLQAFWVSVFLLFAAIIADSVKDLSAGTTSWSSGGFTYLIGGILGSGIFIFINSRMRKST